MSRVTVLAVLVEVKKLPKSRLLRKLKAERTRLVGLTVGKNVNEGSTLGLVVSIM